MVVRHFAVKTFFEVAIQVVKLELQSELVLRSSLRSTRSRLNRLHSPSEVAVAVSYDLQPGCLSILKHCSSQTRLCSRRVWYLALQPCYAVYILLRVRTLAGLERYLTLR